MTKKFEGKNKSLKLAFGRETKIGGWSKNLTTEEVQAVMNLTEEQLLGARFAHRKTVFKKGTPEEFEGLVYELIFPETVKEMNKTFKRPSDDL